MKDLKCIEYVYEYLDSCAYKCTYVHMYMNICANIYLLQNI
jgi:hypothetical protein